LSLNLAEIKYDIEKSRKKKGVMKPLSKEDHFMMSNIQPACNSHHVKNKYFITIRCNFDGCTCCADTPHAKIPLNIVPMVHPDFIII
jgi:hypothetical protein